MTGPNLRHPNYRRLKKLRSTLKHHSNENELICAVLDQMLELTDEKVAHKTFSSSLVKAISELNETSHALSKKQLSQFRSHTIIFRRFFVFFVYFDVCPKDELPSLYMSLFTEVLIDLMKHSPKFQDLHKKYGRLSSVKLIKLLFTNPVLKEEVYEAYFKYVLETFRCFTEDSTDQTERKEKALEGDETEEAEETEVVEGPAGEEEEEEEEEEDEVEEAAAMDTGETEDERDVEDREGTAERDEEGEADVEGPSGEEEAADKAAELESEEEEAEEEGDVEEKDENEGEEETEGEGEVVDDEEKDDEIEEDEKEESDSSLPLISFELKDPGKENASPEQLKKRKEKEGQDRKKRRKTPRKHQSVNSSLDDSINISDFATTSPIASSPTARTPTNSRKRDRVTGPLDIEKPVSKKDRKIDRARLAEFMRSKDVNDDEIVTIEKGPLWATSFEDDDEAAGDRRKSAKRRSKWTEEEEKALVAAVKKYGVGQWANIRSDKRYQSMAARNNVQMKDKWRNLLKRDPKLGIYNR